MYTSPHATPFGRPAFIEAQSRAAALLPAAPATVQQHRGGFTGGQFAGAYRQIAAETGVAAADPHRLIAMLFDGFLEALAEARGAMRAKEIERKGKAINRAVRIVEEGLRAGLNMEAGGKLAFDLNALYGYVMLRLTQANLRNDEAALDECQQLLQPLREAWMSIAGHVAAPHA